MLWNVGRSLRAFNKLHAHAMLAGAPATCRLVHAHLQAQPRPKVRGSGQRRERSRAVVKWLAVLRHNRTRLDERWDAACGRWISRFSNESYALRVQRAGPYPDDPLNLVGSGLFDDDLVVRAHRAGYSSIQMAMQPGGSANEGYANAGGSNLEHELVDVRDDHHSCYIEAEPAQFLQHTRVQLADHSIRRCSPTKDFSTCMACVDSHTQSGCLGLQPVPGQSRDEWQVSQWHQRRNALATRNWTVQTLLRGGRSASTSQRVSYAPDSVDLEPQDAMSVRDAQEFYDGLVAALSGCPFSKADVLNSVLPVRAKLISDCRSFKCIHGKPTACQVARAIQAYPNRRRWPISQRCREG